MTQSLGLVTMVGRDLSGNGPGAAPVAGAAHDREWVPASLLRRFGALFVDWIECVLVAGFFVPPLHQSWEPVVGLVLWYGFFVGLFGQTPGMWLAKIRCVGVVDERPVGIARALLRGLLLVLVVPALIMDKDQRGVHDRYAGTVVVAGRS
jgi:uncharacterized RDD family membrane protein YckC